MSLLRAALHLVRVFAGAAMLRRRAYGWLRLPPAQQFPLAAIRRFYHYYWGTSYLAAVFTALSGRDRSGAERRLFARMAALAAYFDDISEGFTAADDPADWPGRSRLLDRRGTALYLLDDLRRSLPLEQAGWFEPALERVYQAEMNNTRGGRPRELLRQTREKGGNSVLLFRSLLYPPPSEEERGLLFEFGQLIQLCDDIFDVWFDHGAKGQSTLALHFLHRNDVAGLIQLFEKQVDSVKDKFRKASSPNRNKAWGTVFFLVAATRVALDHYRRLALRYSTLPLQNRAEMVVDMAAWPNRWRLLVMILRKSGKTGCST